MCWSLTGLIGFLAVASAFAAGGASAPCDDPQWQPGDGLRGLNGQVRATHLWPRPGAVPALVAAGGFTIAGTAFAENIALWNGGAWEPLGAGVSGGAVWCLATLPNGDLVAGGQFQRAGGGLAARIARWDGTQWSPLGAGLGTVNTTVVRALAVLPDGDLVAAGRFTTAGGKAAANIARWNGNEWFPLGAGLGAGAFDVSALLVTPAGELIAGGNFTASGGAPVAGVARWDGEAWQSFGAGVTGNLHALGRLPDGTLIAAGDIRAAGNATQRNVLRWDGETWLGLNAATPAGPVTWALAVLPDGTLVSGQSSVNFWDGAAWRPLGGGTAGFIHSFTVLPDGGLVMGGEFLGVGLLDETLRRHAAHLARWDGAAWQTYGAGFGGRQRTYVYDFVALPGGDVIAGGAFDAAGGVEAVNVARWDGAAWSALPQTGRMNGEVRALARLPDGSLAAGGTFTEAGGRSARGVARWDGTDWSPLGTETGPASLTVSDLAVLPGGDLVACGSFFALGSVNARGVARWDGTTWQPFGSGVLGSALCLAVLANGHLVLGGEFNSVDGVAAANLARWDGTNWTALGGGVNGGVYALQVLANGDLLVGGRFGSAGGVPASRIARWNGAAWSALGAGVSATGAPQINTIVELASGDLVIGGRFSRVGSVNTANLARWDGAAWFPLGDGTSDAFDNSVYALAALRDGGFVMGGGFAAVDGRVTGPFAHWGCPPRVSAVRLANTQVTPAAVRFTVEGDAQRTHAIEHSTDFRQWQGIAAGVPGGAVFTDDDPERRAAGQGFYRGRVE